MVMTSTGSLLSDNSSPETRLESTQKIGCKLYWEVLLSLSTRCPLCALSEAGALQKEKKKKRNCYCIIKNWVLKHKHKASKKSACSDGHNSEQLILQP